ncbi:unnamed protein product [Oppiella nova]|uniref:EF-hand domain-containing protein n=1 Tax=Oppiella nova TaxID=334625 RepID=A0A7R9LB41_9ACAR|nr:unnamed protein product [Oppiella nova]CAG2161751.1 unnamed protein product [Oppiella nova]
MRDSLSDMSHHQMPEDHQLRQYFAAVDKDRSGLINGAELQSALSNGTFNAFNLDTVHLMISMFDTNKKGTISLEEFGRLWRYITDWLNCFRSFDADNSGSIDAKELATALQSFGYRFSPEFYTSLSTRFEGRIHFDDFLKICIHLQSLTQEFRKYDTDLDGVITVSYEQFISLVFAIVLRRH